MNFFKCTACGSCCSGDGSVFLYPEDVRSMAENFKMTLQEFIDKYTDFVILEYCEDGSSYSYLPYIVMKKRNDSCIFLKSKKCSIHDFKPFQCRNTPFVSEFFTDDEWRKYLMKHCPALMRMKEEDLEQYRPTAQVSDEKNKDYEFILRQNNYSLEKILGVTLPEPKIIPVES